MRRVRYDAVVALCRNDRLLVCRVNRRARGPVVVRPMPICTRCCRAYSVVGAWRLELEPETVRTRAEARDRASQS